MELFRRRTAPADDDGVAIPGSLESEAGGWPPTDADPGDVVTDTESLILVPEGPIPDWLVYQQERDEDAIASQDQAYVDFYSAIAGPYQDEVELNPPSALIVGPDDRVPLLPDTFTLGGNNDIMVPMRQVAITTNDNECSGGTCGCTGMMTSDRVGITAAHCFAHNGSGNQNATSVVTTDGVGGDLRTADLISINVSYTQSGSVFKNDWALFRVPTIPNLGGGPFILDFVEDESVGTLVNHVGIPNGTGLLHRNCEIRQVVTKRYSYDCDTVAGHSGGPIYRVQQLQGWNAPARVLTATHAGSWFPNNRGPRMTYWRSEVLNASIALYGGSGSSVP